MSSSTHTGSDVLGYTYSDSLTGFSGVATGHIVYLTGCAQTLLTPKCREDGSRVESEWFDDQRLTRLEAEQHVFNNGQTPGPDRAPPRSISNQGGRPRTGEARHPSAARFEGVRS